MEYNAVYNSLSSKGNEYEEISDIEELIRRWELLGHLEDHLIIEVDEANAGGPGACKKARKKFIEQDEARSGFGRGLSELEYPGEENGNLSSKFFFPDIVAETGSLKESWPSKLEAACCQP